MIKKTILFLALASAYQITLAGGSEQDYNNAYNLNILITNVSGQTCYLDNEGEPRHGFIAPGSSLPPAVLDNNASYEITVVQWGWGPDLTLKYICDRQYTEFQSRQSALRMKWAGTVRAKVLKAEGLSVTATTYDPSYHYNTPGRVRWTIR